MVTTTIPKHPAPFSDALLPRFAKVLMEHRPPTGRPLGILDPFAGIGRIHELPSYFTDRYPGDVVTVGVELMPKWAAAHAPTYTYVGDATTILTDHPDWKATFDAVVTSPCYGNRMADHHEAKDDSERRSYRHYYGDDFFTDAPREQNAGAMAFGDDYKRLHERAWAQVYDLLVPGGLFLLNVKNHIRNGEIVNVALWHRHTVRAIGFEHLTTKIVQLRGYRYGENTEHRIDHELIYVFRKPETDDDE